MELFTSVETALQLYTPEKNATEKHSCVWGTLSYATVHNAT